MGKLLNYINYKRLEKEIATNFGTSVKEFTIVEKLASVIYLTPSIFSPKESLLRTNKYILADTLIVTSLYAEKLLRDKYKLFANYVHREVVGRVMMKCFLKHYSFTEQEKIHALNDRVNIFEDIFDDLKSKNTYLRGLSIDECVIMTSYDLTGGVFTEYTKDSPLTILPLEMQISLESNISRYLNMMFDALEKLVVMAPPYNIHEAPDFVSKSTVRMACTPVNYESNKK